MILRCVARGDWPEPPLLDDEDHMGIAAQTRDRMGRPRWIIKPTHYAAKLKIPVSNKVPVDSAGVPARETSDGRRVWVKHCADPRVMGDGLYHGVTHVILERSKVRHTEADVWAVQCELVLPYEVAIRCANADHAAQLQPNATKELLAAIIARANARALGRGWSL